MPIYEYRCAKGHTFEVKQHMTDDPVQKCEVCGRPVARVLHPVAVHFKGSGFYNTDYGTRKRQREKARAEKASKSTEAAKSTSSSSDTSSASSTDSKGGASDSTATSSASAPTDAPKKKSAAG